MFFPLHVKKHINIIAFQTYNITFLITFVENSRIMKQVSLLGMLLFFCAIGFVGCGNDNEGKKEIYSLSFEKRYYEVPLLRQTSISVRGGNKDYAVIVEKPNILEVSIDVSGPTGMDNLIINPKQKGETTLTIKDNITNETVNLKVKVTDSYLAYAITKSNHPALSEKTTAYLINNEAKECYFFRSTGSGVGAADQLIAKGTYEFSIKSESGIGNSSPINGIPYLTLNYASDEQGNFTDATIPPTPQRLRFKTDRETNPIVMTMIQSYLGVDWKALAKEVLSRSTSIPQPTLTMTIDKTDYIIRGILNTTPAIPEDILK